MTAPIRLVTIGSDAPRAIPLVKGKTTVGAAADNDIVIEHASVSRRHAVIVRRLGSFRVRDLESTNGTRVNGRRTIGSHRVGPGDEVEFGKLRFAVMNAPSGRRAPGARGVLEVLAGLLLLGFGLTQYLQVRRLRAPITSSPPAVAVLPAGPEGSERETRAAVATANRAVDTRWLETLNRYRAMTGLAAVREDPPLSLGGWAHARYVVKNHGSMIKAGTLGVELHDEERGKPWYSVEGQRAAKGGDIEQWWGPQRTSRPAAGWAIDEWVASTWHRMWILNPRLREVGYGEYCEGGACVAVLDLLSRLNTGAFAPAAELAPIEFPPAGAIVRLTALGNEWPDPLTACRGFTPRAGLPITLQLGAMVPARLTAYSLRRGPSRETLEACGFDASDYSNPNDAEQERARGVMSDLGAAVVIPREPLLAGTYTVAMTVNGHPYTWRFSVAE